MSRVGSALDNAASESLFSTLEIECLRKHHLETKVEVRRVVANWIDWFCDLVRRHSYCAGRSPIEHEQHLAAQAALEAEAASNLPSQCPAQALKRAGWHWDAGR
jgi:hypothetical protein